MITLATRFMPSPRAKLALLMVVAAPLVASCNGIDAASQATERAAYRLNFKQVPLIDSDGSPSRVLNMHVFQGRGQGPRTSLQVPFYAQLAP